MNIPAQLRKRFMAEVINVALRDELGTRESRRLRKSGHIPAVLYGHGEANVNLAVPASQVNAAIRHGSKLVEIQGAVQDSALIRDVQWDAFGTEVLHLDLTRVSAEETVEVFVAVELRGEAPGAKEGGVVESTTHELQILCPAGAIPDKLTANINELHLGQSITAGDLALPDKAQLMLSPETVIVQCIEVAPEPEAEEVIPVSGGEPEVIGRPGEDGEEGA